MADQQTEVIELTLTERELCSYALLAHEQDITLNQWFINAATQYCGELTEAMVIHDKANGNK